MADKVCGICGKRLDFRTAKAKCVDGFVCKDCLNTADKSASLPDLGLNYLTLAIVEKAYLAGKEVEAEEHALVAAENMKREEHIAVIRQFQPTDNYAQAQFDDRTRRMIATERLRISPSALDYQIFSYDQIVGWEIVEAYGTVTEDGIDRAIVGGLLAGEAGAIVGAVTRKSINACTYLGIKITVRDYVKPCILVPFIVTATDIRGPLYSAASVTARQLTGKLELIVRKREEDSRESVVNPGIVDEILRLKELLDAGVLTQEEFEAAKRKAVGL